MSFEIRKQHSLTEFTQRAAEHIARLRKTGKPEILTVDGEAAIVVQDAEAYERLLDIIDSIETIEALRKSMAEFERGEGIEAHVALESIRRKYAIPRDSKHKY